jgi:hypothetical protein
MKEENTNIAKAQPGHLIKIRNRFISVGAFKHAGLLDFLSQQNNWTEIGDLARVFDGRKSVTNERKMRQRLPRAFKVLLAKGHFMVIEYAGKNRHGQAKAVKLYRGESEKQLAMDQIERMRKRKDLVGANLQCAYKLLLSFECPKPIELEGEPHAH